MHYLPNPWSFEGGGEGGAVSTPCSTCAVVITSDSDCTDSDIEPCAGVGEGTGYMYKWKIQYF